MPNKYITLKTKDTPTEITVNFRATAMQPGIHSMDSVETAADGSADVASGSRYKSWSYVLRVPLDDPSDANEGCYSDLETLFLLNDPTAARSNIIELTDHFGDTYDVIFIGDLLMEPLTTMLSGSAAYYMIPVRFREI